MLNAVSVGIISITTISGHSEGAHLCYVTLLVSLNVIHRKAELLKNLDSLLHASTIHEPSMNLLCCVTVQNRLKAARPL